ncbi:hypothetical protein [Aliivibrio fischeri]|uniref:hypothetical protein n=3 Tax=Aliivibrio fischeri TaxID=668 RepID=UPI001F3D45A6|nr:hypothetical protein [Aliivibrio fischeri]MCE7575838.1 hypothetical protein [Aliivibrio fischeri]
MSITVLNDYQDLLNHKSEVQLSLLPLWVPVGFLGILICMWVTVPKAFIYGKKINDVICDEVMKRLNKIAMYSALLGVVFAVGFALYSMKLLDEYGYEYSYELTDITPTGIHLMYVKSHEE